MDLNCNCQRCILFPQLYTHMEHQPQHCNVVLQEKLMQNFRLRLNNNVQKSLTHLGIEILLLIIIPKCHKRRKIGKMVKNSSEQNHTLRVNWCKNKGKCHFCDEKLRIECTSTCSGGGMPYGSNCLSVEPLISNT